MSTLSTMSGMSATSSATYGSSVRSSSTFIGGASSSLATTPHQSIHRNDSNRSGTSDPIWEGGSDITSRMDDRAGPSHDVSVDPYMAGGGALSVPLQMHDHAQDDDDFGWEDMSDHEDDGRFVNFALLSNIAVRLRDKVPRGTHTKGNVPYSRAFTGKDIVVCFCSYH